MNPIILPLGWRQASSPILFQRRFTKFNGLVVLVGEFEQDGDKWLYVSCSHRDKLPKWKELREVKNIFIGREKTAIQVFPPESKYVDIMPFCLHLCHNLDRIIVPDFTEATKMI